MNGLDEAAVKRGVYSAERASARSISNPNSSRTSGLPDASVPNPPVFVYHQNFPARMLDLENEMVVRHQSPRPSSSSRVPGTTR
jgi:hypothetical protein